MINKLAVIYLFSRMYTEWVLIDTETGSVRLCTAPNQEEALRRALELGIYPQDTNHVKPRLERPESDNEIMNVEEFQEVLDQIT